MSTFQIRGDGRLAEIGDDGSIVGYVEPLAMPATGAATPAAQPTPKPLVALTPRDVVRMARARRAELRIEIKKLERLKSELAQLDRLIKAANGKSFAPVRELKRSAS